MARALTEFPSVRSQGALLPPDILLRIKAQKVDGSKGSHYDLPSGTRLNERISEDWGRVRAHWADFQKARSALSKDDRTGATVTRTKWLQPLLRILQFGDLPQVAGPELEGKHYPIRYFYRDRVALHLLGCEVAIDKRTAGVAGAATGTPHSLVQEFLNRSDDHLWAVVTNGLQLRLLRDNVSLSRQAYVEFDLEAMMEGQVYADFSLLWMLLHATRFQGERPEECWLEKWSKIAADEGARVLGGLRDGVTKAIEALGQGFIGHPANDALRDRLRSGDLSTLDLYRQVLRTVYRLLFLFVAEDRDLLHVVGTDAEKKRRYFEFYSLGRIRGMADRMRGTGHGDLWQGLTSSFGWLEADGCGALGLTPLGSFLWARQSTPDLLGAGQAAAGDASVEIANEDLLDAVRCLAFTEMEGVRRAVDYRNLGAEELGSVYESLLELTPEVRAGETADSSRFELGTAAGNERKTSGSYYTPDSLVQCLLDSALDPVVEDRLKECKTSEEREQAILTMTVCDPAVGSGHFLIAAAHRLARVLAGIRTGDQEPAPEDYRHALRDVIARCLYGVDINPMSAELCRVALWMEAMEPGKPLSFLDHHIVVGNSLIGATPALLAGGIPDGAFKPLEGDDKTVCTELKKKNKTEREYTAQGVAEQSLFGHYGEDRVDPLLKRAQALEAQAGDDLESQHQKEGLYRELREDPVWQRRKLASDGWCAAFMWRKDGTSLGRQCPTSRDVQAMLKDDKYAADHSEQVRRIRRLAEEYRFFHWHLMFPGVLSPQGHAGFHVVVGNPPYVDSETMSKESPRDRATIGDLYKSASGNWDVYVVFVERAISLLCERGIEALVTPVQLLASDYAIELQRIVLARALYIVHDFSDARPFRDAAVGVVIAAVRNTTPASEVLFIKYDTQLQEVRRTIVSSALLHTLPSGYIAAPLCINDPEILAWLSCPNRLSDVATLSDGATTAEAYRIKEIVRDCVGSLEESDIRLVNTGTIDPFRILWGLQEIRYLGFRGRSPVISADALERVAPKRQLQAQEVKVVIAGMASRLEAAVAHEGVLCGKSAVLVRPRAAICPHALSVVLNAPCINALYSGVFGSRGFGSGSMNIGPRQVEQLPIPHPEYLRVAEHESNEAPPQGYDVSSLSRESLAKQCLLSAVGQQMHRDGAYDRDALERISTDQWAYLDHIVRTAYQLTMQTTITDGRTPHITY